MGRSIPAWRLIRVLEELIALHDRPAALRMDNGISPWCRIRRIMKTSRFRGLGRPSYKPVVRYASLPYQADRWTTPRRVVANVEHPAGELFPRVAFIVTKDDARQSFDGGGSSCRCASAPGRSPACSSISSRQAGAKGAVMRKSKFT